MIRLAPLFCLALLLATGCDPSVNLCEPLYDFSPGDWNGGEGSAPGGVGEDDGDDDDAVWDDDDAVDDDDVVDADDYAGDDDDSYEGDDDDYYPSDDDDAAWDDDDLASDDDDYYPGDDDDSVSDDDDSAAGDEGRDEPVEERDEDGDDLYCAEATEEPVTMYMSADDSNSQADPSQHREMILHHGRVPTRAKAWEYLNWADFDYVAAPEGTLRIVPEMRAREDSTGTYDLLVAVVGPEQTPADRSPFNLVFSLDVSGSMSGPGIEMMQSTLRAISGSLKAGDFVSVVLWSENDDTVLEHHQVIGPNDPTFGRVIDGLIAGGSTDLDRGLEAAYELASSEPISGATNRVVLISDGGANVGNTSSFLIAEHAQDGEEAGVYLVGIGVPPASDYDDSLMDEVTDLGRGAYLYIDNDCEAERRFTPEGLPKIFGVAALDVQLAMTLPSGFVVRRFSGEQISYEPADVVPQHLAPNDEMLYDIDLLDCSADEASGVASIDFEVEWRDPRTGEPQLATSSFTIDQLLQGPRDNQRKAEAMVAFARTFRAIDQRDSAYAQLTYLDDLAGYLEATNDRLGGDVDVAELQRLVDAWRAMYDE